MDEPEDKPPAPAKDNSPSDGYFLTSHQNLDTDDVPQLEAHDDDNADAGHTGEVDGEVDAQVEVEAEGDGDDENGDGQELQAFPAQDPQALRLRQEMQLDGSEFGSVDASSVDALPRRAGSPGESMLSGPDDTPSVQVCLGS